ncbi:spore germination protein [Salibacterium qingdaonense]|uniref:Stage V sporulation protein AF n=1 Tax=Salibacterium qingdaonense TaxID=266892 RepID=A0A1I4JLG8_9BACI|nr:spore germination protein [Salibacterium qingdaonense]SFL67412.1 stage V sporulation protein AF [Salibacterium qingdaonense]
MTDHSIPVSRRIAENKSYLASELAVKQNFDIIELELEYNGIEMALYMVDGFVKDQAMTQIQRELDHLPSSKEKSRVIQSLITSRIPYVELDTSTDLNEVVNQVLSGPAALVVDGEDEVILIDTREYPVRSLEEPQTEQVVRGSKDGFVETIIFNTALTRRRIRDRNLRMEYQRVGKRSLTDVSISYIADIADEKMVDRIRKGVQDISSDGLPMADKTVEEYLFGQYVNPYPLVRYTERPDTAAVHLLEGHVLIYVDGSPTVMIVPCTFWHHLQHAEEYRQKPIVGTMHRLVRYISVFVSLFLLPLWFIFAADLLSPPEYIDYLGVEKEGKVPLISQFIIAEVGIEMLRMAAIHTPSALATALGIIAAILIGQISIEVGLFSYEVVLYLAVAAIGSYATPSYELSLANRIWRFLFLLAAAVFGAPGFTAAVTVWFIFLVTLRPAGVPYLWPLLPFSAADLGDIFKRKPIPLKKKRPSVTGTKDPDRTARG